MRIGGVEVWCSQRSSAQGFSFDAITDGILLHMETDFGFWRFRWGQQERAEFLVDVAEGDIVREQGFVNFRQTLKNRGVGPEFFAHCDKGANDVNSYRDGA